MAARITTNRVVVGDAIACTATRGAPGAGDRVGDMLFATDTVAHLAVMRAPAVESAMSPALACFQPGGKRLLVGDRADLAGLIDCQCGRPGCGPCFVRATEQPF